MGIGTVRLDGFVDELQQRDPAAFCFGGIDHRYLGVQRHVIPAVHSRAQLNRRAGADDVETAVQVRRQADEIAFMAPDPVEQQ